MNKDGHEQKSRTIRAHHLLQSKVGAGLIDARRVRKAQALIDKNKIDFLPEIRRVLTAVQTHMATLATILRDPSVQAESRGALMVHRDKLIDLTMQLKGNAGMFHYELVSDLAGVVLRFLEGVEAIDRDVLDIVEAFHKTLSLVAENEIKGGGGDYGIALTQELQDACHRYFIKTTGAHMPLIVIEEPFFIDSADDEA